MTAKEFIVKLESLVKTHGNLDMLLDDETEAGIEFSDEGDPAFIVS